MFCFAFELDYFEDIELPTEEHEPVDVQKLKGVHNVIECVSAFVLILNGSKNWITHGKSGEVAVVIARTGELLDSRGMTAFIVERGTEGFSGG